VGDLPELRLYSFEYKKRRKTSELGTDRVSWGVKRKV